MATKQPIEATLSITIEHHDGPEIADPDHVRRWLCADGMWAREDANGFRYDVCPDHSDPDECDCPFESLSEYKATIVTADSED
ncbi:MAG: hypothetical protein ACJ786_05365 [Catenulispora sp.]|jgi:hypothetical protein